MDKLTHLLYITFVAEDRYRFFLNGLGTTLLLTFASFLMGTALGIALCAALRSRSTGAHKTARVIMTFFMETPTMVLLMILVYVVFGSTALPILWAVVIGLTLAMRPEVILCDELLFPVLRSPEHPAAGAAVRLLCSESSARHTLLVGFRGLGGDPLAEPYLDELNLRLLNNFADFVFSRPKDEGWEVCIQM